MGELVRTQSAKPRWIDKTASCLFTSTCTYTPPTFASQIEAISPRSQPGPRRCSCKNKASARSANRPHKIGPIHLRRGRLLRSPLRPPPWLQRRHRLLLQVTPPRQPIWLMQLICPALIRPCWHRLHRAAQPGEFEALRRIAGRESAPSSGYVHGLCLLVVGTLYLVVSGRGQPSA